MKIFQWLRAYYDKGICAVWVFLAVAMVMIFNDDYQAVLVTVIFLCFHFFNMKINELRFIVQVTVLTWLFHALLIRMELLNMGSELAADAVSVDSTVPLYLVFVGIFLAAILAHGFFDKKPQWLILVGSVFGAAVFYSVLLWQANIQWELSLYPLYLCVVLTWPMLILLFRAMYTKQLVQGSNMKFA